MKTSDFSPQALLDLYKEKLKEHDYLEVKFSFLVHELTEIGIGLERFMGNERAYSAPIFLMRKKLANIEQKIKSPTPEGEKEGEHEP